MTASFARTAARPSWGIWWVDDSGALIDFSAGYTFSLKVGSLNATGLLTKTTGITGAVGSGVRPTGVPNVVVAWAAGELATLTAGNYAATLTATTGGLPRVYTDSLIITDTVL